MTKKIILLLIMFSFIFISCNKDDEIIEEPCYETRLDAPTESNCIRIIYKYDSNNTKDWIDYYFVPCTEPVPEEEITNGIFSEVLCDVFP